MGGKLKKVYSVLLFAFIAFVFISFKNKDKRHPYKVSLFTNNSKEDANSSPLGNPMTAEGVWLGRLLFYDTLLSGNHKQSCGSCHKQKFSFTDGLPLAIGSKGDTLNRNTMPILNLAYRSNRFFWDGHASTLEERPRFPITHPLEMNKDTTVLIHELKTHKFYPQLFAKAFPNKDISIVTLSLALAQFMRTIVTRHTALKTYFKNNAMQSSEEEKRFIQEKNMNGLLARFNATCTYCHEGYLMGGLDFASNFINPKDTDFLVPSLVNVNYTFPLMHTGQYISFASVLSHYESIIPDLPKRNPTILNGLPCLIEEYDKENLDKLFALFQDSTVLTNQLYSNPFAEKGFDYKKNPFVNISLRQH